MSQAGCVFGMNALATDEEVRFAAYETESLILGLLYNKTP